MHERAKTALATVGIVALAFVGTDAVTYASTGDSLILGHGNKSNKTTHIKSTGKGPALSLHAKGKRPALAVDSTAKIRRLNADKVDGKSAGALQNNVRVYTTKTSNSSTSHTFVLPSLPKGRYLASYEVYILGPDNGACYFGNQSGTATAAYEASMSTVYDVGISGSGVLNKGNADWYLICTANAAWSVTSDFPVRVSLTKIDKTIGGGLDRTATSPATHPLVR